MPDLHLWDNFVGPPNATGVSSHPRAFGVRWHADQDGYVNALRYYRVSTEDASAPATLELWDAVTVEQLVSVVPPSTGPAGWTEVVLPTAIPTVASHNYVISAYSQSIGLRIAYVAVASAATPPYPLVRPGGTDYASQQVTSGNFTTLNESAFTYALDIAWNVAAPSGAGGGGTVTSGDLATWFSADSAVNTHQNALPWLTKAQVNQVKTDTGNLVTSVGNGLNAIATDIQTKVNDATTGLVALGTRLSSSVVSNLTSAANSWADWLGATTTGWTDWLAGAAQSWADLWTRLLTGGGALPPVTPVPGTGWANTASTAWDTNLAWAEPADVYVITATDLGGNIINTVVAGVDVSYRLAWWCPLDGTQPTQRRFIDTPSYQAVDGGRRMPGLLLHSPVGASGTVDAWIYTAP